MTPFKGTNRVTSPYGYREYWYRGTYIKENHKGQDIVGDNSWDCRAIWDSQKVETSIGYNSGRGNMVILYYSNSLRVIYQHLGEIRAKSGTPLKQGGIVGVMGSTGQSTGAHLHLEVQRLSGAAWVAVEPSAYSEVPNRAGSFPGNDNYDAIIIPKETVTLYTMEIGPVSKGDENTLIAAANSLFIINGVKPAANNMSVVKIGPMTNGDKVTFERICKDLKLKVVYSK